MAVYILRNFYPYRDFLTAFRFSALVLQGYTLYLPMNQNAVEFHAYNIIGKTKQAKRKKKSDLILQNSGEKT